ncbi:MAG: HipA domain-containing protein [Psychrosphaera sp.]|nr:HipA domain-containing protein [Psychrosphaera sp.]
MTKFKVHKIEFDDEAYEQLGTKEKFWFANMADEGHQWLFKFSRKNTGEHWSEKVAEQLCELLEIPHVKYELATCNGKSGIISKDIIPSGCDMMMGNQSLYTLSGGRYPKPDSHSLVRIKEHTVNRVLDCLDSFEILPPTTHLNTTGLNAGDVFCGYLLLDTLISNQDRHHENWAIINNDDKSIYTLSPTYDHAASLGRELLDAERAERLETKDKNRQVASFVLKAKSELFRYETDKKPLKTIDAFYCAVKDRPNVKTHWLSKLQKLTEYHITNIFDRLPNEVISPTAKAFAIKMIMENQTRTLNDDRA